MTTVAILGAGNMGTALAQVIAGNGHKVLLWSIEADVLQEIRSDRRNTRYLPGIHLNGRIDPVWELGHAAEAADLVLLSVPSHVTREIASQLRGHTRPGQTVINVAKGLEGGTHKRMSEVLVEELGEAIQPRAGSLGGPAIATEMANGLPMAVIVAAPEPEPCRRCQSVLQNEHLKVQISTDLCGLELCSTLKNAFAIALGMCDGLGYGTNAKAFLATLSVEEMFSIVMAFGGQPETVYGLAGLGDVLTTGLSPRSRNRRLGEELGAGRDWQAFVESHTVEGIGACRVAKELTKGLGLTTPVLDVVYGVLFGDTPASDGLPAFFRRFSY